MYSYVRVISTKVKHSNNFKEKNCLDSNLLTRLVLVTTEPPKASRGGELEGNQ